MEIMSRLTTLSTAISGGTISERIVNDIQARNRWIEVFRETARFYDDHTPFEIIFDPNLIQIGDTDYDRNRANLGMRIMLQPSQAGFSALNSLLEGLVNTGRRDTWRFSGWPLIDTHPGPATQGTVVFDGRRSFQYRVDITLINENNKTIGRSSANLAVNLQNFSAGQTRVGIPANVFQVVNFNNVRAQDLTPTLTISINSVNELRSRSVNPADMHHEQVIRPQGLNVTESMRIDTGNLEMNHAGHQALERQAQIRAEEEAAQRAARRQDVRGEIIGNTVMALVLGILLVWLFINVE